MKRMARTMIVLLVVLLVGQPMLAAAGSGARLFPMGDVSLLAGGKEVNRFKSEMPMPDGLLMVSQGNCVVQANGLQFIAQDKAVFALADIGRRWDLTVKTGRIDFAMRADAKRVAFHTPQDVIEVEQAIVPASGKGLVRGYITVTEEGAEIAVQEGTLQVASSKGSQVIKPGQSILLAQANMVPPNNERKDRPAGAWFMGGGYGPLYAAVFGMAGIAGLATYAELQGDGTEVSPF